MNETLDFLKGQFQEQKKHLDFRFDTLDMAIAEGKMKDKEQDKKINKLENERWYIRGAAVVVIFVLSAFGIKGWFKF